MFKAMAVAVSLCLTGAAAQAATIFSDDFDDNVYGLDTTPIGWVLNSGSVDIIGDGQYDWYGPGNYIDMNGSTASPGSISTTVTGLVMGQTYTLSFDVGYNNRSDSNEQLSFSIGDLLGSHGAPIGSTASTFLRLSFSFVAGSNTETLTFADTGPVANDNGGPVLDNVTVSQVPVPAAGLLLLGALGGLAALRRRKAA